MEIATEISAGQSYDGNAQFWIRIIRERLDRFRTDLTDHAVLSALGDCSGRRILDAGCGEGYLSRILHSRGARVVGIDASAELIDAARRESADIDYHHGSVDAIPLNSADFDDVVCNHLVNDLPDPAPAFGEFARILRPDGKLTVLMLHPCFYQTFIDGDETTIADQYFGDRSFEQSFRVAGEISPTPVTVRMRSLEYYVSALAAAGFVLETVREPRPPQTAIDPWWQENFRRPIFLLLVARRRAFDGE
ncbi:class I SAM-dependent methyltransferase [Nocardia sp. NPDC051570]|uniref:class I SAM-dependent methyltransferase n=1 Tax=Nocardia sp. NPDC051570 TaxID=3364324 RepID=UPI0037AF81B1